jgi:hypothetical protein
MVSLTADPRRLRVLAAIVVPLLVLSVGGLTLQRSVTPPPTSTAPTTQPGSSARAADDLPGRQQLGAPAVSIRTGPGPRMTPDPTLRAAIERDARWILRAQLPDGAIATHLDHAAVWPYLGNFAAIGLVEAARQTGERRYLEAAWRWLAWYQEHQDARGFVTDYRRSGGAMVSTGDMDSTDAYAGTFLLAVWAALRASGDPARLVPLRPGIAGALHAIEATQDRDGLTWAKPGWDVKYLMDQAETYAGLRAASELAAATGDGALANRAADDARRLRAGVAALWDPSTGAYDWAKHAGGARQRTNWRVLYPDALQQVWAVAFGLADPVRGAELVARFEAAHPRWDQPTSTALYDKGPRRVGYWAPVGWAFARAGRPNRARAAAGRIRAAAVAADRRWPFTPSDAAQLIVLESAHVELLLP